MAEEATPRYDIVESDRYDADRQAAYLRLVKMLGPEYAARWLEGLNAATRDLSEFPGPLSHAVDYVASPIYRAEVRRLLYSGPTKRRGGTAYRILFILLPADEDNRVAIRLIRLLHGAQMLIPPEDEEQDD